ncbi:hypothetical protein [Nitrospirillum amazonense]|uniref:hypothetical protein n=1 Tax=Nitrospirillum amazonense TaxID=28077 RepID=UPI002412A180|nr:hypothetical protein [Nitrospirillum amazonense]MDG3444622.1 hypothetical protein [Nitrospirillum amazonense]
MSNNRMPLRLSDLFMPAQPQNPANEANIDPHIRDLVYRLNRLPGVQTLYSCQGHRNKTTIGAFVMFSAPAWFAHRLATWLDTSVNPHIPTHYVWGLDGRWQMTAPHPRWFWILATNDIRIPGGLIFRRHSRKKLDGDFSHLADICEQISSAGPTGNPFSSHPTLSRLFERSQADAIGEADIEGNWVTSERIRAELLGSSLVIRLPHGYPVAVLDGMLVPEVMTTTSMLDAAGAEAYLAGVCIGMQVSIMGGNKDVIQVSATDARPLEAGGMEHWGPINPGPLTEGPIYPGTEPGGTTGQFHVSLDQFPLEVNCQADVDPQDADRF